jgi:hypothetical protein
MTTVNRLYRAVFTPKLSPRVERLARIYREAPQYKQRLWVALFLMSVVSVALVSALYLNLTASAAIAGRQIQYLELEIEAQQRTNADLQVALAGLLSAETLQRRAYMLGFRPVERETLEYMVVPGYTGQQRLQLVSGAQPVSAPAIPPDFNQSLLDWLDAQFQSVAASN